MTTPWNDHRPHLIFHARPECPPPAISICGPASVASRWTSAGLASDRQRVYRGLQRTFSRGVSESPNYDQRKKSKQQQQFQLAGFLHRNQSRAAIGLQECQTVSHPTLSASGSEITQTLLVAADVVQYRFYPATSGAGCHIVRAANFSVAAMPNRWRFSQIALRRKSPR